MRTFPRSLAAFRQLIEQRCEQLRSRPFRELQGLAKVPPEDVTVGSRQATIHTIVEARSDGSLRVVLQGLMKPRLLPFGSHVAVDGFYKNPDGSVASMSDTDFYEFS
jgi:hypothetical protein